MGRPIDDPKFKELKEKWDRILEETGFPDLEDEWGNLKQRASNSYRGADIIVREAKLDFYTQVSQKSAHTQFPNKIEKFILECFADGIKQVQIQQKLASVGIHKHRVTIYKIIRRWLKIWGLR